VVLGADIETGFNKGYELDMSGSSCILTVVSTERSNETFGLVRR
jgi:hypothetical protein